jgi:FMN phosphatase YigB (HAD superfamily)
MYSTVENAHLLGNLISDSDGVITDFSSTFHEFMKKEKGLISVLNEPENFNFSDAYPSHKTPWIFVKEFMMNPDYISKISVYEESKLALASLHSAGVKVIIVTSIGDSAEIVRARTDSLDSQIGAFIDDITVLPAGHTKEHELAKHSKSLFIDDLAKECNPASLLGHKSFLFDRKYNQKDTLNPDVVRMKNGWKSLPYFK